MTPWAILLLVLIVASIAVLVAAIVIEDGGTEPIDLFCSVILGTAIGTLVTALILGLARLPAAIGATT